MDFRKKNKKRWIGESAGNHPIRSITIWSYIKLPNHLGVLCIYGKINNSAYNHRDASFNHQDASYNHQDARFNHRGAKCSSLYYELCVNLGA